MPCLLLLIVGVVILATTRHSSYAMQTMNHRPGLDANGSTTAPTLERLFALLPMTTRTKILQDVNQTLPPSQAYAWILGDPHFQNYSDTRLVQRFALTTFYHATDGPNWKNQGGQTVTLTTVDLPGHGNVAGGDGGPVALR